MALHLHRAERTDLLADGLGALLSQPLPDPFASELILVPARGVERWLSQRLSHVLGRGAGADGVCAGVEFRNPRSLIAEITGTTDDDPWAPDTMVWPLLEVIDESLDEDWCRTLATHLGRFEKSDEERELRLGRRYAVARRIAGLFASYASQRPQLLVDWLDGDSADLPSDLAWQPPLWRALTGRVAADPPHVRQRNTVARLRDSPADVPQRLSLFGHTRLPRTEIELIGALATHHDLHLWLPHPSDDLWRALGDLHDAIPRRDDTSHRRVGHPLLATLGRDLRELQRSLPADVGTDEHLGHRAGGAGDRPDTLLGWLQSDIAANTVRPQGRTLAGTDRSVQVHACHGPARQVDVLREVLLGLLADDPTLEPRDILVMCPDIETYAPLINADFGLGDVLHGAHPAHRLRMRLADRSLVQTNPLLARGDAAARPGGQQGDGQRGAQLRPVGAGARPLRVHRRQPRGHHPLGAPIERPLGFRPGAPQALRGRLRAQHMAFRDRPRAGRRRDVGRRAHLDRLDPAARRRQQQSRRARRAARRVRGPPAADGSARSTAPGRCGTGWPR